MELSDEQREFLRMGRDFGKVKGLGNVRKLFDSKKDMKRQIGELEDEGFVERVSYGVWKLTEKGRSKVARSVCENCGNRSCSMACSGGGSSQMLDDFL